MMMKLAEKAAHSANRNRAVERPPIVLSALDRERLVALLRAASTTMDPEVVLFLREELDRADVIQGELSPTAVVAIGSTVKFIDHAALRARQVKLVHPDEANGIDLISVTGALGSALIGLGPGQTISWRDRQTPRRLSVLETTHNC